MNSPHSSPHWPITGTQKVSEDKGIIFKLHSSKVSLSTLTATYMFISSRIMRERWRVISDVIVSDVIHFSMTSYILVCYHWISIWSKV